MNILKKNLIDTPSYNQISEFVGNKNERGAYLALVVSHEGENFTERTIEQAFSQLNYLYCRGEPCVFGS